MKDYKIIINNGVVTVDSGNFRLIASDDSIPEDCSVFIQYNGKNTINNRNGYYFNMDNSAGLSGYVIDVQKNGNFKVRGITNAGRQ